MLKKYVEKKWNTPKCSSRTAQRGSSCTKYKVQNENKTGQNPKKKKEKIHFVVSFLLYTSLVFFATLLIAVVQGETSERASKTQAMGKWPNIVEFTSTERRRRQQSDRQAGLAEGPWKGAPRASLRCVYSLTLSTLCNLRSSFWRFQFPYFPFQRVRVCVSLSLSVCAWWNSFH